MRMHAGRKLAQWWPWGGGGDNNGYDNGYDNGYGGGSSSNNNNNNNSETFGRSPAFSCALLRFPALDSCACRSRHSMQVAPWPHGCHVVTHGATWCLHALGLLMHAAKASDCPIAYENPSGTAALSWRQGLRDGLPVQCE